MKFRILLIGIICYLMCPVERATADSIDIREWLVPWENTRPRDPYVDDKGRVWFVGQTGDYVGNMSPDDGQFNRYDLREGTGPHNLLVDGDRNIWYAGNLAKHIGKLSPSTGKSTQIKMPERKAKDPHTLVFDHDGNIWFTVQHGNFVGRLTVDDQSVDLIEVATKKSRPYGIVVDYKNSPWAVAFGTNKLLQIFPETMTIAEIELPDKESRPRRLAATSNGDIWYADFALGRLGRYRPLQNDFQSWAMPGGAHSRPYGMAVDNQDRVWLVETGVVPNRFVGFDTARGIFLNETNIPSGGGSVRHMFYDEPRGEIWFGTDTNYVGRAKVQ